MTGPHVPLRLRLDGAALLSNWRWLAANSGAAACGAAVKADGYGLGARAVVQRLRRAGVRDFFVATWAEAHAVSDLVEPGSLSVLHGVGPDDLPYASRSPSRPVLNTAEQVRRWRETGRPCDVMIDTGMNRLGLSVEEVQAGVLDGLNIHTLMSHLACADEPGHSLNARQRDRFRAVAAAVKSERLSLANSAGICLGSDYAFDLTRPGLALYGGIPMRDDGAQQRALKPVAAIEAQVLQVRRVLAGQSVGYSATFVAPSDLNVAIINLGYADGYLRLLGRAGHALAGDVRCPIRGVVSMDLIALEVPEGVTVGEGDWLSLPLDLPVLSAAAGLTQYELLTGLSDRFERRWT